MEAHCVGDVVGEWGAQTVWRARFLHFKLIIGITNGIRDFALDGDEKLR